MMPREPRTKKEEKEMQTALKDLDVTKPAWWEKWA